MSDEGKKDPAVAFTAMADRIKLNAGQGFAGAFVIVPPEGDAIEVLLLNTSPNLSMFWGAVKGSVDIAQIEQQNSVPGFGQRR